MNLKTNAKARLTRRALFHADFWAVLHDSISCKKCINVYQIELFAKKLAADYQRQKKAMYQDVSFWVSSCHHLTDKCIMNGFSSPLICTKIAQKREKLPCYSRKFLSCWKRIFRSARPGGGGESRTPVREYDDPTFYERSRRMSIPLAALPTAGSPVR